MAYLYSKYIFIFFCFHLFVDEAKGKIHYKITKQNHKVSFFEYLFASFLASGCLFIYICIYYSSKHFDI